MSAARNPDRERGVDEFDRALFGHIGFTISNAARSLVMALTLARFESVPDTGPTRRYYQHIERFSASFAFATDVAMLTLGGYLKKKESISARLGDVLSSMYLASMVLKHHEDQGSPAADLPIVEWSCRELLYQAQEQLHGVLRNFPVRPDVMADAACSSSRAASPTSRPPTGWAARSRSWRRSPANRASGWPPGIYRERRERSPLGQLQQALELAPVAELDREEIARSTA